MIRITLTKQSSDILGLHIHGHANSDEYGKDLICAGVSAIGVGLLNGLEELAPNTCQLTMQEGDISIRVQTVTPDNQLILQLAMIQFITMEESNKQFIRIKKQEV